jgi:hypothetical protein
MTFSAESCCWITISSNLIYSSNRILFSADNSIVCFYAPSSYSKHFHYRFINAEHLTHSYAHVPELIFTM